MAWLPRVCRSSGASTESRAPYMASGGMKFPSHTPHTFAHRHHAVSFNIHTTSNAFVKQPRGSSLAFGLRAQREERTGAVPDGRRTSLMQIGITTLSLLRWSFRSRLQVAAPARAPRHYKTFQNTVFSNCPLEKKKPCVKLYLSMMQKF